METTEGTYLHVKARVTLCVTCTQTDTNSYTLRQIRTTRSLHAVAFDLTKTALRYAAAEPPLSPDTTYAPTIQAVKYPRTVPPITSDILYLPQGRR